MRVEIAIDLWYLAAITALAPTTLRASWIALERHVASGLRHFEDWDLETGRLLRERHSSRAIMASA